MHIKEDVKLDFNHVLLVPKISTLKSRDPQKGGPDLHRSFQFIHSRKHYHGIPIVASNMDGVGTFSMAKVLAKKHLFTVIRKHYSFDDWVNNLGSDPEIRSNIAVCTGTGILYDDAATDFFTMDRVMNTFGLDYICVDVANGYQMAFVDFIKQLREEYPDTTIIAGNVATPEITENLILSGADIVKVGIGPGSVCTTRIVTGVGYPQLSAIIECADAAHGITKDGLCGRVMADGGCTEPGDVAKAFAGGADFVMLGGMLAAHDEGEYEFNDHLEAHGGGRDTTKVTFYGMSSDEAMQRHGSRKDGYRGPEGKQVWLQRRGPVEDTIDYILGGVSSACTYVGAVSLKELTKRATFVKVFQTHNTVFSNEIGG